MNSQEETDIEKLRALCYRWNRAAADAGICGSEYHDDPEQVFYQVKRARWSEHNAFLRAKGLEPHKDEPYQLRRPPRRDTESNTPKPEGTWKEYQGPLGDWGF